jgi:polyphosphate kinase 2
LERPSDRERGEWYYQRNVNHFPTAGEMVLFDGSWYNRAGVEQVMGYCSEKEYRNFINHTPDFERLLVEDGTHLIKLWFSVSQAEQRTRFLIRRIDPVRQWKLSPTDIASLNRWDDYTAAKEAMFATTDTDVAPWTVVKSNDKKRARINAIRHVLHRFDYPGRNLRSIGDVDSLLVGPASDVYEQGEAPSTRI